MACKTNSTSSSSSSATINHYHHHPRSRHHRAAVTWTDSHAIHARGNTERDTILSSSLAANYFSNRLLLRIRSPPPAFVSSSSSSSFPTHPAICAPFRASFVHPGRVRRRVPRFRGSFRYWTAHSINLFYYPGTEITRSFLSRILHWLNWSDYIKQDPTNPDNIRLLQLRLNEQILIR